MHLYFKQKKCDMNRLSINAKKDEKSPYPLENNELGIESLKTIGGYTIGYLSLVVRPVFYW